LNKTVTVMMMILLLAGSLGLVFNIQPAKAEPLEPPATEWSKTYGGAGEDSAWSVAQTSDGGYIVAGSTTSFGAGNYDFWLVKTDAFGNMEWNKTYGGPDDDRARSVLQTNDGGYMVAGSTTSFYVGWSDAWLIKTDSNGNMQWNKTYGGGEQYSESATCIVQTIDGGYAFTGRRYVAGYADFWLVKIDSNGNQLWTKTFEGAQGDESLSVAHTNDGGYIIAGHTYSFGAYYGEIWLVKTDTNGNQQWGKTFRGQIGASAYSVRQANDYGYIITGTVDITFSNYDFWLIKTDSMGNMQWNKTYGGAQNDHAYCIVQTIDGGYAVAGGTSSFGAGLSDAWVVKADSSGNMQWSKTIGGTGGEVVFSIAQTRDSGLILAGSDANADFWLIKVIENNPPDIGIPSQNPPRDDVQPHQNVTVSANVTDAESGVKNATLCYSLTNGTTWEAQIPMSQNATTSLYEATISGQPIGIWVRFKIVAYDIAGNNATLDGTQPYCVYQVVPELPLFLIPQLFMIASLLTVIVYKRKHLK